MSEIFRTRDLVIYHKGDIFTPRISEAMRQSGWIGGQGVQWADPSNKDDFVVTFSDGWNAGIMLWGSDETSDKYTAITNQQLTYGYGSVGAGDFVVGTIAYEKYTWASRQLGPLVPITYTHSDSLYFSLRGYWTKEDEWTLSGDPRAPNTMPVGVCMLVPSSLTLGYMKVKTLL